ncbi:hypothetical protein [Sphingomicrobium astaxanthinifaciens]|uniref:hypothetical protein n=1 Tax=Sphingomicrobium astaxanthinifaciens TaxID=1227949 RepID=UPI001FCC4868|nr:hypothetical protein [Sphingomicrobium astaxanthinifaciens]MCJ7421415.1 hypothetical protein [Sphingomicrobium astaxanthinifaciens]
MTCLPFATLARLVLACVVALPLAACATDDYAQTETYAISGDITYRERVALPRAHIIA